MPILSSSSVPLVALGFYWVLLPVLMGWGFRLLTRESALAGGAGYRTQRHLLSILARTLMMSLAVVPLGVGLWFVLDPSARGWTLLWGLAIFVGFAVVAVGFLAIAFRFALAALGGERPGGSRNLLVGLRLAVLVAGMIYGLVVFRYAPSEPGQSLIALYLLGGALMAIGLNRSGSLEPERVAALARALRGDSTGEE